MDRVGYAERRRYVAPKSLDDLEVEAVSVEDLTTLIDVGLLRSTWRRLFLPVPVRRLWEHAFVDLATAA
jgi:hypothetical protein